MKKRIFRRLLPAEEARRRLLKSLKPDVVGVERIRLEASYGRVLAEDITSPINVPPFDRSIMDGYAVHAEDTYGASEEHPVNLKIVGSVNAGEEPDVTVNVGEAVEVSTGAPIPEGADAVVMLEYTDVEGDTLRVFRPVSPGENIMPSGSDISAGELILRAGTLLTPRETGVLAAIGIREIKVYRRPKVAVISTGDELIPPGEDIRFGKIYDINSRTLSDSVIECGGEPLLLGIVRDNVDDIKRMIRRAAEKADAVIISGGASVGSRDFIYEALMDLDESRIIVDGISVKPGKPTLIAIADGKPIFSLPGYPVSALMIFNMFVAPVIRLMAGLRGEVEVKQVKAKSSSRIIIKDGRREYMPVSLVEDEDGKLIFYRVPGGSGAISSLAKADGFIEVPGDQRFIEEGEEVTVNLFSSEIRAADLTFIGSHCIGVDLALKLLRSKAPWIQYKIVNVGSSGGLAAVRRGEADISGVHLLDEETGEYNVPFIEDYDLEDAALLFRGYLREQGLIVEKENPKGIWEIKDLLRGDLRFINRNHGSGTRRLLDAKLRELSKEINIKFEDLTSKINGYNVEVRSHTAVAAAVAMGRADVGVGIRAAADIYGLDFIPISNEQYDFIVRLKSLRKKAVQLFIETIRSEEFKSILKREASGLTPTDETGNLIYYPRGFQEADKYRKTED